jgi:hypothetical protein
MRSQKDIMLELDGLLAELADEAAQGNKTRASEALGWARPRFYRVLERRGLYKPTKQEREMMASAA